MNCFTWTGFVGGVAEKSLGSISNEKNPKRKTFRRKANIGEKFGSIFGLSS